VNYICQDIGCKLF